MRRERAGAARGPSVDEPGGRIWHRGYSLAIGLEASGLLAFALGAALTRYERRSKSVGLKRFLASGQASDITIAPMAVSRPRRDPPAPRVEAASSPRPRTASEAALALRSAFAAPAR